jgi:hypothetical protein
VANEDWREACLRRTLSSAGYRFNEARNASGNLVATFNYGPSADNQLHLRVIVETGAFFIHAAELAPLASPTPDILIALNELSIDWGVGRLFWHEGYLQAAVNVFAYADHDPPAGLVQWICHHLWETRRYLAQLQLPMMEFPAGPAVDAVVAGFTALGMKMKPQADGAYAGSFDTGDEGSAGVRICGESTGVIRIDALPLAAPAWPTDFEHWLKMNELNANLLVGAVTRWNEKLVVRQSIPAAWIPAHAQWPKFVLDAASWACIDIARIGKGGPVARRTAFA